MKVSVIIPVYNAEQYLERCLKAVLSQTHEDLEIILINDGSTDGSGAIIRACHDDRIVVIEKKNGGVSAARNDGLRKATGECIVFVDADDYPEPAYIEKWQRPWSEAAVDLSCADTDTEIRRIERQAVSPTRGRPFI